MANKNSRTKNSALSLVTGIGGQLLNEALRFITRTVFIYTLGKMFLGINGLFSEIMVMLSLTNLGVGTAIIYRLYKPIAENDEHQVRVLLKFYKKAYQAIGAVILVLGLCLLPFLEVLIKDYDRLGSIGLNAEVIYLLFLGQSVVSYFFFAYRNCVFAADQKQYIVNAVNMVTSIVTAVVQIVVLYLWHDFIIYLLVGIVDSILKNVVIAVMTYRQYPNYFMKEPDSLPKEEVKSMFKDCGALLVYKINQVINKSSGNLILSTFIGLAIVGVYSNYLLIYVTMKTFLSQIMSSFKASLGNLYAVSSVETKYFFFQVTNFVTIIIVGTMAVSVACVCDEFIYVWLGEDFIIPQPFAFLLAIELLLHGLVVNFGQIRNIAGLFRQMWIRPVISLALNLTVTLFLVKIIGVYAIQIGIIVSLLVTFAADPVVIHRYGFKNYRTVASYYLRNARYVIVLVLSGTIAYVICRHTAWGYGWISVIFHGLLCASIVPLTIVLLFNRTPEFNYLSNKIVSVIKNRKK